MTKFNPLDHPICLSYPLRLTSTNGSMHVPVAMTLIDLLRPALLVELGTTNGVLYCSFCQAVRELNLDCRCYGVGVQEDVADTSAVAELRKHHDSLYAGFSRLMNQNADEALADFADNSIDLLHLENVHSYQAVKNLLDKWLPKVSDRGIIVLGNTNRHDSEYDVWKLWQELKAVHPHFEFAHHSGLGVLAAGANVSERLRPLLETDDREASLIRAFFSQLGDALRTRALRKPTDDSLESKLKDLTVKFHDTKREVEEKEAAVKILIEELGVAEKEAERIRWDLNQAHASYTGTIDQLRVKEQRLESILASNAWRWVTRYGKFKNRFILPAYRLLHNPPAETPNQPLSSDEYRKWVREYDTLTDSDREAIRDRIKTLEYQPLMSVIMPVYDVDEKWLRAAIESVRKQLYTNWELCIADDASPRPHVRKVLEEYTATDPRIKAVFRQQNGHISAASNSALELATGDFTTLLDHDDEIPEHALYLVVEELNAHPEADLIYSDEDKICEGGERCGPHFKTEFNPDLLYSYNMISHLGVYRTSIMKNIGGFREGYEGSQDYDLALRVIEQVPASHVRHIPHVLYHWRAILGSVALEPMQKEYAHDAARRAIRSHLKRMGIEAFVTEGHGFYHRVTYPIPSPAPLVSFIMGTRDRVDLLRPAVEGLLEQTYYQPVELIIVDNQSRDPDTVKFLRELEKDERVKVIRYDQPFNFAAINNLAVKESRGELVCLINNDIKVISPDWLREMVSHALRPEIGAVGAKLYYPNNRIQHAGIILGVSGIAEHAHRRLPREIVGYVARTHVIQSLSAVTGACMMLRRKVYEEVNGFDEENLAVAFNDIDLCLRLQARGYRILWTPYAELYHFESASRGFGDIQRISKRFRKEIAFMNEKWGPAIANDPYYSPNLTAKSSDFSLAFPPRAPKPWRQTK